SDMSGAGKFVLQKDSSFTYTYTVTNNGPNDSGTFDVVNTLPAGFTPSIALTSGSVTSAGCVAATCSVDTLSSLGVLTVTITGDPTALLAPGAPSTPNQLDLTATII